MESCYIQLSVAASGLMDMDLITHSDPYAIFYELVGEKRRMIGKTEVVMDCLAPKFAKKFEVKLDINRTYLIVLFDWDYKLVESEKHDRLGEATFTSEQVSVQWPKTTDPGEIPR